MDDEQSRRWLAPMAEVYDRVLGPSLFLPFALDLAARAAATSPGQVLEVAAGTGVLTAALVDRLPDAHVVATDLNPAMVAVGSRAVPAARWQPADALDLPFDDATFDVVACQFGVMFFPDRVRGWREMGRVTTASGRVWCSTWDVVERHAFAAALQAGLASVFPDDPPRFVTSVPHGYADLSLVSADVDRAGLELIGQETITLVGHGPSAADLATGFCLGTPLRAQIEARGDLASTVEAIAATMADHLGPGPVEGAMTAHVLEARPRRRPAGSIA